MSALAQLLAFLASPPLATAASPHIRTIHLPTTQIHTEPVSCIYYNSRTLITGTDIIRALLFRFRVLNISIGSLKKFEEGVFSDLRNLKVGNGCQLEEPRSALLIQLHELGCIRTQKKQKVFFWECVNHDYLFTEALTREKKRNTQTTMDVDWQTMVNVWESTLPLKITVQHFMDGNPTMFVKQPFKSLFGHSRSPSASGYSRPATPMQSNLSRSLPISMYDLLNNTPRSVSMPTPDSYFNASLWNDEAIAAVAFEVLNSSPELFAPETDPVLSNWLAESTPSDIASSLGLLDGMPQLECSLFDMPSQVDYSTDLLNLIESDSKKRDRSLTASSTASSRSAKRFQPYSLVRGH